MRVSEVAAFSGVLKGLKRTSVGENRSVEIDRSEETRLLVVDPISEWG